MFHFAHKDQSQDGAGIFELGTICEFQEGCCDESSDRNEVPQVQTGCHNDDSDGEMMDAMHSIVHNEYVMDELFGEADYKGNYPCCRLAYELKQKQ